MTRRAYLTVCMLIPALAQAGYHEIGGMAKVEARQKQEVWCWAAVIQIVASAEEGGPEPGRRRRGCERQAQGRGR